MLCSAAALAMLLGCVSLTASEREMLHDLDYQGIERQSEGSKKMWLAGTLNLLPGIGNVYLEQWGPFVGNFLMWPFSIAWAVPQAIIDSNTINEKETADFYRTRAGQERLKRAAETTPHR